VYLTEHLAGHGYVVTAPDHRHNTMLDYDEERMGEVVRLRPLDVRLALDAAIERSTSSGGLLSGVIDASSAGVAGHSFGGFTALVVGGARMDVDALRAACAGDSENLACQGADETLTPEFVASLDDPRVRATLALAPGGRIAFGPSGLSSLHGPSMIQAGTRDTLTTLTSEAEPIYDGLPSPKRLVEIDGAAHFSFTDICPLYARSGGENGPFAFLAEDGCGTETISVERAHAASRTLATAFFDLHLRGLPDEHGYLDPARGVADTRQR
jgi:predicted dienelactone hydrolase